MASVSPPVFDVGPPKKISADYTVNANETPYMAFLQDLSTGSGENMNIDTAHNKVSIEYDWQSECQYRVHLTFNIDIIIPATAPEVLVAPAPCPLPAEAAAAAPAEAPEAEVRAAKKARKS